MHFPINETEIAIPFKGPQSLKRIQKAWEAMTKSTTVNAKKGKYPLNTMAHMRFLKGSDAFMSPAYQNEWTCYMDFGAYSETPGWTTLVRQIWETWGDLPGVKLHWAKDMRVYEDLDMREMYGAENVEKFLKIRKQFDPKGLFANDFMRGLFKF